MNVGPVELLVVRFPGNHFRGEILPALRQLVESGTIRIIDILFAFKDDRGTLKVSEINDLDEEDYAIFDPVVSDLTGILSQDDIQRLAGTLENNSSEAIMLFENTWATRFRDALVKADGELVLSERIPRSVIEQVLASKAQPQV